MMLMILSELLTGFLALRHITRHQANKFHLQQFMANNTTQVEGYVNKAFEADDAAVKKFE